jgi:hypothetical protein
MERVASTFGIIEQKTSNLAILRPDVIEKDSLANRMPQEVETI